MRIDGYTLRDHARLLAPSFGLIAAVWALRLVLGAIGVSGRVLSICSVNTAGAVALLLGVLLIHSRHFGGYTNVVAAAFLLECCQQGLIIAAIAFATLTGTQNIFTATEFSASLSPLQHMLGHLTFGIGLGTLYGTAMGCLLLWMLRKFVPSRASH